MNMRQDLPLSHKLANVAEGKKIISNLYSEPDFAQFYESSTHSFFEDVPFYKFVLSRNVPILEIGTGNGRVFVPLLDAGYDIYGIEPELAMRNLISKGSERVFPLSLEEIGNLEKTDIQEIIIPATTISLFSRNTLAKFLSDCRTTFPKLQYIYFDYLEEEFFYQTNNVVDHCVYEGRHYYFTNFIRDGFVFFNIVTGDKIGISRKYLHSGDSLSSLAKIYNFSFAKLQRNKSHIFASFKKLEG